MYIIYMDMESFLSCIIKMCAVGSRGLQAQKEGYTLPLSFVEKGIL